MRLRDPENIVLASTAILMLGGAVLSFYYPTAGRRMMGAGFAVFCVPLLTLIVMLKIESWRRRP
jgi:hypothetical protein